MNRSRMVWAMLVFLGMSCGGKRYLSPVDLAIDRTNNVAYTALSGVQAIAITELNAGKTIGRIALNGQPNGVLLSPNAGTLYVACGSAFFRLSPHKQE